MKIEIDLGPQEYCDKCPCFYNTISCEAHNAIGVESGDVQEGDDYLNDPRPRPKKCIERFGI